MKPISFVKGHMGGNEIVLLNRKELFTGRDLEIALQVLYPPNIRGHEVGLLHPARESNHIRVDIVGGISKQFISMCGGLTQVLGKAIITTNLAQEFDLIITKHVASIILETILGPVKIAIPSSNKKDASIMTDMTSFAKECYYYGIESLDVFGVHVMKVGKFLVANADAIHRAYPNLDIENTEPKTLSVLRHMQEEFNELYFPEAPTANFSVYDLHPLRAEHTGRVIFPHGIASDRIEPACGTGTVAIGLAMAESGEIDYSERESVQLLFESGGTPFQIGGPDITTLKMEIENKKITRVSFSHSLVEIIATGHLWI